MQSATLQSDATRAPLAASCIIAPHLLLLPPPARTVFAKKRFKKLADPKTEEKEEEKQRLEKKKEESGLINPTSTRLVQKIGSKVADSYHPLPSA